MTVAITDLIGSTGAVIDLVSGALVETSTYYPNGARETYRAPDTENVAAEPYGFTGKEADEEVGVTYFGERYLIARVGRWASPDPSSIHRAGGGEALNSYHYVSGHLLQARDPLGLEGETAAAPTIFVNETPEGVGEDDAWTYGSAPAGGIGSTSESGYTSQSIGYTSQPMVDLGSASAVYQYAAQNALPVFQYDPTEIRDLASASILVKAYQELGGLEQIDLSRFAPSATVESGAVGGTGTPGLGDYASQLRVDESWLNGVDLQLGARGQFWTAGFDASVGNAFTGQPNAMGGINYLHANANYSAVRGMGLELSAGASLTFFSPDVRDYLNITPNSLSAEWGSVTWHFNDNGKLDLFGLGFGPGWGASWSQDIPGFPPQVSPGVMYPSVCERYDTQCR